MSGRENHRSWPADGPTPPDPSSSDEPPEERPFRVSAPPAPARLGDVLPQWVLDSEEAMYIDDPSTRNLPHGQLLGTWAGYARRYFPVQAAEGGASDTGNQQQRLSDQAPPAELTPNADRDVGEGSIISHPDPPAPALRLPQQDLASLVIDIQRQGAAPGAQQDIDPHGENTLSDDVARHYEPVEQYLPTHRFPTFQPHIVHQPLGAHVPHHAVIEHTVREQDIEEESVPGPGDGEHDVPTEDTIAEPNDLPSANASPPMMLDQAFMDEFRFHEDEWYEAQPTGTNTSGSSDELETPSDSSERLIVGDIHHAAEVVVLEDLAEQPEQEMAEDEPTPALTPDGPIDLSPGLGYDADVDAAADVDESADPSPDPDSNAETLVASEGYGEPLARVAARPYSPEHISVWSDSTPESASAAEDEETGDVPNGEDGDDDAEHGPVVNGDASTDNKETTDEETAPNGESTGAASPPLA